ncbi:MAG TPA: hypothetical protein VMX38_22070 [Verrucomicrobiae bacterium]|jgi:hypothetical protein|nr:hypothetical protein [Verrucomicrobiae bacterium]
MQNAAHVAPRKVKKISMTVTQFDYRDKDISLDTAVKMIKAAKSDHRSCILLQKNCNAKEHSSEVGIPCRKSAAEALIQYD